MSSLEIRRVQRQRPRGPAGGARAQGQAGAGAQAAGSARQLLWSPRTYRLSRRSRAPAIVHGGGAFSAFAVGTSPLSDRRSGPPGSEPRASSDREACV